MPESSDEFDVVCFGALNADIVYIVDRLPKEDDESFVVEEKIFSGGSAANTASALANFGNNVAFVGKVGRDDYGEMLKGELLKWGVKPVLDYGSRSGKAMVFVDRSGKRAIIVDPGANDEVNEFLDLKGKLLHLTSFVCLKGNEPFKAQLNAADKFENVSLDPGAIYAERGDVWELIEKCNLFLPNAMEIEKITSADYRRAAKIVLKVMGGGIVVVKLGKKGCYATDGLREVKVEAFDVKAVDTTGAGDAFNAGFIHAWLEGHSLEVCLKAGNYVAAYNVQRYGARNFPEKVEFEEFLNSL